MDIDHVTSHQVKEVRFIVQERQAAGDEEDINPRFQLCCVRMLAVLIDFLVVITHCLPKLAGYEAAHGGATVEVAHRRVPVDVTPYAGTEPGKEASV